MVYRLLDTLKFQLKLKILNSRNPDSLEVCALLVRSGRQEGDLGLRYIGFEIPPDFVVGYGLDVAQRYRNLSDLWSYDES